VNSRIVVVLSNGSVVSMEPWSAHAKGIVESWLLGQAGGSALVDVLFGSVSPSGKLAQSIPLNLNDDPSTLNWPGEEGHVDYGEGVFVGYRYYDSFKKQLAYPFGFGMSYADFTITDVHVEKTGANTAVAQATVSNVSAVAGAQTVQVYVAPGKADVARPVHELKGFAKTYLEPGESREVSIPLDERSFAYWSQQLEDWHIEKGTYNVEVGTSSRDIYATQSVTIEGDGKDKPLNEWSNLQEWRSNSIGAKIVENMVNEGKRGRLPMIPEGDTAVSMFIETMPLNTLSMLLGEDGTVLTQYLLDQYGNATA
jgi:beta-glucosidase